MPDLKNLMSELEAAENRLRDAGCTIVRSVVRYEASPGKGLFSTRICTESSAGNVTADHVVLDAIRDISTEWSNAVHSGQLKWSEPA